MNGHRLQSARLTIDRLHALKITILLIYSYFCDSKENIVNKKTSNAVSKNVSSHMIHVRLA